MSEFVTECDIDVALTLTGSKTLRGDLLKAKAQMMVYYLEEIIQEHFNYPNPNFKYKYKPNTSKYEMWKKKYHPESLYQLVLSGRLRNAVLNGKIDKVTGKIVFNLPEYGLYQLKAKRNFIDPSAYDLIDMQNRLRRNLFFIRSERSKMSYKGRRYK
jgi:hypothetical protein